MKALLFFNQGSHLFDHGQALVALRKPKEEREVPMCLDTPPMYIMRISCVNWLAEDPLIYTNFTRLDADFFD